MAAPSQFPAWPTEGLTRVPYWVYQDADLYRSEMDRVFRGRSWNFLCLDVELPAPNTFRLSDVGDMPVVVTRDAEGAIHAFENRCAHRGALLCLKPCGEAREIACVYHNWTYDLKGNLTAVAFRRGIKGSGGMLPDARPESNSPRQLKIENYHGLVFGTLAMDLAPVAEYLGEGGPRTVARVMSTRGGEVPWWRVLRADGTPAPQVAARQLRHLREEATPMRPSGDRVDIAHARWHPSALD